MRILVLFIAGMLSWPMCLFAQEGASKSFVHTCLSDTSHHLQNRADTLLLKGFCLINLAKKEVNYQNGLTYAQELEPILKEVTDSNLLAEFMYCRAEIYHHLSQYKLAIEDYKTYVKYQAKQGDLDKEINGLIHERLYRHESLVRISFNEYLEELLAYLKTMVDEDKVALKFNIVAIDVAFKINTAIPLGLIINELVTNAIKYAFEARKKGEISIELRFADDKNYLLVISDNGNGFDPEQIEAKPDRGIGTKLVKLLVRQLRASYDLLSAKGTKHFVKIPFN